MPQITDPEGLIQRVFPLRIEVDDRPRRQNLGKQRWRIYSSSNSQEHRPGRRKRGVPYPKENQIRWTKDLGNLWYQLGSKRKTSIHG